MNGVPAEEGFVSPMSGDRHPPGHRFWKRGPWLLRALRIGPLGLTVVLAPIATLLQSAPSSQLPRVHLGEIGP
jgi:hypothetical protein